MTDPIPGPRGLPLVGNMLDVRHEEGGLRAMENLADIYGDVFRVSVGGKKFVIVSSAELLKVFTDENQFEKTPPPALDGGKGPRGLFIARGDDPDWGQAHRILTPAFGPLPVEGMIDGMKDIASQLLLKWARQGDSKEILLTDDFTRLTLDTIALCTMDYRFNSFYSDAMHPFVDAMLGVLSYSGVRASRPALYNKFMGSSEEAKFREDQATMDRIAKEVIDQRRANPTEKRDLLACMLNNKDPRTNSSMRDELIMANMVTFLIAGHETTSGLLSFAFMFLLQNPKAYLAAQAEVDQVLGTGPIETDHFRKLKYLNAVLRETLRLMPTAPGLSKRIPKSRHDEFVTICEGRYRIENDDVVRLLLGKSMRDPRYFGVDAEDFRPERMHEDNPDFKHYMQAWKPFGNGSRSCIGQSFAWQEALLVTALILQNFDMSFVDPGYQLVIKQTLTIKPKGLYVKVRPRKELNPISLDQRLHGGTHPASVPNTSSETDQTTALPSNDKLSVQILFGSNSGTCQSLAQKLSSHLALKMGVSATVRDLDSGIDGLSSNQPLIVITSSYEGQPPDNAARFVAWLESSKSKDFEGLKYAVFGCGHKDWHETFHRVPKLVDTTLEERGATRITQLGTTDVSEGAILDDFEDWQSCLVKELAGHDCGPMFHKQTDDNLAEITTDQRSSKLSSGLALGKVKDVKVLTAPTHPEKRHMEIELPEDSMYEAGDYLAVLPLNPDGLVQRILQHWSLPADATVTLKSDAFGSLPINVPLSVTELLKGFFELSQPVSKRDLQEAKQFIEDNDTVAELEKLISDEAAFQKNISSKHTSLFDLLERYQNVKMPFPIFLSKLLPLRVRQYSISSSPMSNPSTCTITYTVVKHTTSQDTPYSIHEGVASTYLSTLTPGDTIHIATKRTATANLPCPFRLPPAAPQSPTPLLMFCAGSGLAPFRGFIQQRALMLEQNPSLQLAPALLFIGCRSATGDRLYADELDAWAKLGAVDCRYAFSQEPEHELAAGSKYVADRILRDMADVRRLWKSGARVYVCCSRKVQDGIRDAVEKIWSEVVRLERWDEEVRVEKEKAFKEALATRAVSDIFD